MPDVFREEKYAEITLRCDQDAGPTLLAAGRDASPLVRAEAVKAAVFFQGLAAAEVVFEVATRPTDPELDFVLNYARQQLKVDQLVQDALKSGTPLSKAAETYVLRNASVADLLKLDKTEAVYRAILSRKQANSKQLQDALVGLAKMVKTDDLNMLIDLITELDASKDQGNLAGFARLLVQCRHTRLDEPLADPRTHPATQLPLASHPHPNACSRYRPLPARRGSAMRHGY